MRLYFLLTLLLVSLPAGARAVTATLTAPQRTLMLKSTLDNQGGMNVQLTAYRRPGRRLLWQKQLYKNHTLFDVTFAGTLGRAVLLKTDGGEERGPLLSAYDLNNGDLMWLASGSLLGQTDRQILLISPGIGDPNLTPANTVPLTIAGGGYSQTDQPTIKVLPLPPRPGCGSMRYQAEFPDLRYSNRYLYALRQDKCGKFIARFNWHGEVTQKPLIYPDNRPATPEVDLPPGK